LKVVLVSPNAVDRALATEFLRDQAIETLECSSIWDAAALVGAGVGCIVLVEEALEEQALESFHDVIAMQPAWSDMPLIIIASQGGSPQALMESVFPISGNMTLLQRPLHPLSLVAAVRVALRSRRHQYQVRDLLEERERAVRQRDEFLAMLAHELRNPLAPIRYAAYLMGTQKGAGPLVERCRALIDRQARHITRLVDDLLDVSRLELGKIELRTQRVDLNEVVAGAVEASMPVTSDQKHEVTLRTARQPVPVRVDPVRLEQAISNLIVNAAKFTPPGGSIALETRIDAGEGVVTVTDTGIGIRPDMLESIFDLFTQSEVTIDRAKGGLGIGLTLVRRLIELHGGTVKAYSEGLGKGSRFEARLPLVSAQAGEHRETRAHPHAAPRRVLVAEDVAESREALGMLLREWRHEVVFAADGPEAVRVARNERPDIALIDIGLPGFDGYTVAREIRGEGTDWARGVRLIALTGYGQASDRTRALEAGFNVHLLKPVDPVELEGVLAKAS
jgi:signal transduction histidine kinase/CheY-like chemotaxis protein